ncbi:transferase hexapeptide repeat family protein [uncultured Ruegeria sp.]|uniref:acyltransferase n=1 Tax=uncultured Ruegeria sp. TaxID=259304 RepID=UPI0026279A78|nr:transferase hexapeptide repeat family protein [uncultured Ruegeria sp.]
MGGCYAFDDVVPVIAQTTFVHPDAVILGDVIIGEGCYVGPAAVLRGDFGRIIIGDGSNIQETCVLHSFPGRDVIIERSGHVGHGAVLHGCHLEENVLIGMNSVIMDEVRIARNCIVGALSFVKAKSTFEPRQMIAGSPARVLRPLTESEINWKSRGTGVYQELARRAASEIVPVDPLRAVEPDRRRVRAPDFDPLVLERLANQQRD